MIGERGTGASLRDGSTVILDDARGSVVDELDGGPRRGRRGVRSTGARASPRVASDVHEAELVGGRELLAAGVKRGDVVDARRAARARRRGEVDRLAAELASVVGSSSELRHHGADVLRPSVTTDARRRHSSSSSCRAPSGRVGPGRATASA